MKGQSKKSEVHLMAVFFTQIFKKNQESSDIELLTENLHFTFQ